MLPRVASLISCAALVLFMANTSNAVPSNQELAFGDVDEAFDPETGFGGDFVPDGFTVDGIDTDSVIDGDGDDFQVSEGDLTKRDRGTCPQPSATLKAFWDDVSYGPNDYGCHKGYCWSRCAGGARLFGSVARDSIYEWCYTTKGHSQDRGYITCSKKEDCCDTWSCAGPCAAF
ncbi:hypothetical protein O0I10_012350 [Lichtheimia ornata]|uniref:Uncharacterized protein n=1 Tax=Lichtheimia ornata TaxID=688661 RepID=A0AAD7XTA2_9FUNG|nr:uncharacterized protein O0I10_012350 [Lichtheimia ornata]KAJ8652041.1 hypothetical protein O0I10_012350 [Lichtheimia ornata]